MSNRESVPSQLNPVFIVIGLVLAIPILYFVAYLAALDRKVYYPAGVDAATGINRHRIEPSFRFFETGSKTLFEPALWIDRHIRNECWDTVEKEDGTRWRNP